MEWKTYHIIIRPNQDGTATILNENNSLKDSRYWLNYIAEPFDALCMTPLNPKYAGQGEPTYYCHLIARNKTDFNEIAWKKKVFKDGEHTKITFVPQPLTKASLIPPETTTSPVSDTEIIELADGSPRNLTLEQIKAILTFSKKRLKVVLAEPTKWIDWESALTLMTKEVHIIGISSDPKWPLTVTLNPNSGKGENMNYSEQMKFMVKN